MTMIFLTAILAVLYGLAWHNEPARRRDTKPVRNADRA